jgi:DNA adenine methylase
VIEANDESLNYEKPKASPGRAASPIYLDEEQRPANLKYVCKLQRNSKILVFGWYGGKFSHLAWLLPLLPTCHHYCEPFAGSGAVLLNRAPSPVETYNDIDGEVVNFFRILRDQPDEITRHISLRPEVTECPDFTHKRT